MEFPPIPHFLTDLRSALSALYQQQQHREAHDYLLHLQSRNVRRQWRSWKQKQQALSMNCNASALQQLAVEPGSSWMACLALLLAQNASSTERLFCAQTLLHRTQRSTLHEAMDWEMETGVMDCPASDLAQSYGNWMQQHVRPALAPCLQSAWQQQQQQQHSTVVASAERLKGIFTMVTIAHLLHEQASAPQPSGPLCQTLASLLATVALRLRFQCPPHQSLVQWIQESFHHARQGTNCDPSTAAVSPGCFQTILALPETVMGQSPGGRISIDPKMTHQAISDLTTVEWPQVCQLLLHDNTGVGGGPRIHPTWILQLAQAWVKSVPLPEEFVQQTVPIMSQYRQGPLVYLYWMAMMETATWTVQDVVSMRLGLTQDGQQQATKRRMSSRSKKKKQAIIERESTDDLYAQAEWEVRHRGTLACLMVQSGWDLFFRDVVLERLSSPTVVVDGEGPMGCLAAAATSCLPYILLHQRQGHELFRQLATGFQELCRHSDARVRALSFESLHTIHGALLTAVRTGGPLGEPFESFVVDFFSFCAFHLILRCPYPTDYFRNLCLASDEELEIERNDVREIVRTIAGSGEGGSTSRVVSTHEPLPIALRILSSIVKACHETIVSQQTGGDWLSEPAVHALSALAKPLNCVSKYVVGVGGNAEMEQLLCCATSLLCQICQTVVKEAFQHQGRTMEDILARCRTAMMAMGSLSPMISSLCRLNKLEEGVLPIMLQAASLTIEHIPELFAESTIARTMYDIRGTMRGPGGEDHVGCLALMRLAYESEHLARTLVAVSSFIPQLCHLQQTLKRLECERPLGVFYGKGSTPISRRILLGILSHLEVVAQGQAGAAPLLEELFHSAVVSVAAKKQSFEFDESTLFQMSEHAFDLAAFSPAIVSSLFTGETDLNTACLEALTSACIMGYHVTEYSPTLIQWNRLRAALFKLFEVSSKNGLSPRASEMIKVCVFAENEAALQQCQKGQNSSSAIFLDSLISEDSIPSGIFLQALGQSVVHDGRLNSNTLASLMECRQSTFAAITHNCPDPNSFADPRPTLCEAWLLSMVKIIKTKEASPILLETFVTAIHLIYLSSLGKKEQERAGDPRMSMDGPHSSLLFTFLMEFFLQLGQPALQLAAEHVVRAIPIDPSSIPSAMSPAQQGLAVVGAALFRAAQGSLPPWVVEVYPELYGSFYTALGKSPQDFCTVFRWSMEVKSPGAAPSSVLEHMLGSSACLAGASFGRISQTYKDDILSQAAELCQKDDLTSWRSMKTLVKQACGGKKKDSEYKQKPSLTRWEFVRL